MARPVCLSLFVSLLGLVVAGPAGADHHRLAVSEVMLSTGGNSNAQFVELQDSASEPFPIGLEPYKLVAYDAQGMKTAAMTLNRTMLANHTTPILISTAQADSALSSTGDAALSIQLPSTGQVCYTKFSIETPVYCFSWGCFDEAGQVTGQFGQDTAAAPADGKSVQQVSGIFRFGNPTPNLANVASTSAACATPPPPDDGDPPPDDGDPPPDDGDPLPDGGDPPPVDGDPLPDGGDGAPQPDSNDDGVLEPLPGGLPKGPTAGADKLIGTRSADTLRGLAGNDTLIGGGGNDRLFGGPGRDTLDGGRGDDLVQGDAGRDEHKGGRGNDTIRANDGSKDQVDCGAGRDDKAIVDPKDVVKNCEKVRRRS